MARRRQANVFSLSFLDAIACGFGAAVLLFMIINASIDQRAEVVLEDLTAEVDRMELKVLAGRKNLVQVRDALTRLVEEWTALRGMREELVAEIRTTEQTFAEIEQDSASRRAAVERLRQELAALESESERISAANITAEQAGDRLRGFTGEGNRQYLTGMLMGGRHVAILVDVSTSMLDRTIVNIIRRRNMPEEQQRAAPKWRQAVDTVDWLTTQIEPGTNVQIIAFNDKAWSLFEGSDGQWQQVTDGRNLDAAVNALRGMVPSGPSSLHAAFGSLRRLNPKPDNVYLVTDGLPTMGDVMPTRPGVTGRERLGHFNRAARELPVGVPVNVILLAMEGDPQAAPAFWTLALRTGGSMLAPAEDWP